MTRYDRKRGERRAGTGDMGWIMEFEIGEGKGEVRTVVINSNSLLEQTHTHPLGDYIYKTVTIKKHTHLSTPVSEPISTPSSPY